MGTVGHMTLTGHGGDFSWKRREAMGINSSPRRILKYLGGGHSEEGDLLCVAIIYTDVMIN